MLKEYVLEQVLQSVQELESQFVLEQVLQSVQELESQFVLEQVFLLEYQLDIMLIIVIKIVIDKIKDGRREKNEEN